MSKKPLVEDYQQQTPQMAEAIAKATALQDADDAVIGWETGARVRPEKHEAAFR